LDFALWFVLLSRGMPGPMKRVLSVGDLTSVLADHVDFDPGGGAFTQVKSRSKRSKKTNISQSQSASGPTCVSAVDSQSAMLSHLQKSVCELNTVVQDQKALIDRLTTQLNFVMSYLDITAVSELSSSNISAGTSAGTSGAGSSAPSDTVTVGRVGPDAVGSISSVQSYAGVVRVSQSTNSIANQGNNSINFRQAVATEFFTNLRDKDRRAKSVIVNGLSPSDVISDSENFRQLCVSELSINPQVSSTRRLGRVTSTDGRTKPLLVYLGSKEEMDDIIKNAKTLRRSMVSDIRDNVYINRNLTRIEAQLAYEERCRRRQRFHQRQQPHPQLMMSNQQSSQQSPMDVPVSVQSSTALRPDAPTFMASGSSVSSAPV